MNNIFEDAKFGDKFLTEDNKIVIYMHPVTCNSHCIVEQTGDFGTISCNSKFRIVVDGSNHGIISKIENPIDLFKKLPHLTSEFDIVEDWGYAPTLYYCDSQWVVDWISCEEGDSLIQYASYTPEEAIYLAYNSYKKDIIKKNEQHI